MNQNEEQSVSAGPGGAHARVILAGAAVCSLFLATSMRASAVEAQTRFVLSPTVGVYAPLNNLLETVIEGEEVVLKQQVGIALGGRAALFLGPRFSVSITGSYVPSELQGTIDTSGFNTEDPEKVNLWFGSGRLNYWLLPPTGTLALGINGGVGVAGRGAGVLMTPQGEPLETQGTTDVGGVLGATVGVNLGGFGLFASVDSYIYNPSVFEQMGLKSPTQNDLQFSFGFGVPVGGGGR